MPRTEALSGDELASMLSLERELLLIDVRELGEGSPSGSIAGAIKVPHRVFLRHLGTWAKEAWSHRTVVVYCQYGQSRSVRCSTELASALEGEKGLDRGVSNEQDMLDRKKTDARVFYLEGGFSTFMLKHPEFVEYT